MRAFVAVLLGVLGVGPALVADTVVDQARDLERKGGAAEARLVLQRAAESPSAGAGVLVAYAEFLDRYRDPAARPAYEKALAALQGGGDSRSLASVARRLVLLSLLDGDRVAAAKYLEAYRAAGGRDWPTAPGLKERPAPADSANLIDIPGPFTSFARMAAVSQEVTPEDLLPALARNIVTNGYQASGGAQALDQTEYLKLLIRYMSQARELEKLAGSEKTLRIETCESAQTGELLRILGYRIRGGCGSDVVLETVNATRAFLTIDSGFPLADLEQDLRTNRPFVYPFKPARAPVLFGADYWLEPKEKREGDFIDAFVADPALCRLYLGFSKLDPETAEQVRKAAPLQRLKAFSHVLDFFGGFFEVRGGKSVVPGGARSERAWEELVGVSPDKGGAFFERLISKDDGWLAGYFDALARAPGPARDYLTEPERLKRFYAAIRGRVTSPGPARPVFRANTDLILLTSRLHLDPDVKPHIPGGLEIWKDLFIKSPQGKYDRNLSRQAPGWKTPDDVLEAQFALCRKVVDDQPLKIFIALSDLDAARSRPLEAGTVDRLARGYRDFGAQYTIFSEVSSLGDKTIVQFLDTIDSLDGIKDNGRRADAAGIMQALVGLWQILCREGSIPASEADQTLASLLSPFENASEPQEVFDAGRAGVQLLLKVTGAKESVPPQDRIVDLLAGAAEPADAQSHAQMVQEMTRIFEAQRLVSLNILFEIAGHLDALARGESPNSALFNRMAATLAEIELPRSSMATAEKNAISFGYYSEKHVETERKLNLRAAVDRASGNPQKLRDFRGLLTPFLRDSLVGFNYIHYATPGAQVLYVNPGFVRSHDFIGLQGMKHTWRTTDMFGSGWPSSAGGRLMGSLAALPYALAEAEQNFLIPSREQALIWGDLVPQMILSAKIPRWWNVSPAQLHWVGLHMRYGESLLAESALDPSRRDRVLSALGRQVPPARAHKISGLLEGGEVGAALDLLTPAEVFALAEDVPPGDGAASDPAAVEMRRLASESPATVNYQAISTAFGTPKPTLTHSYRPQTNSTAIARPG